MEEQKAEGNSLSKKPWCLAQFTDFGQFSDLEIFDQRISWFLRSKDPAFLWFFPKGPLAIYSCNCTLVKGNNDTFQGLLDIRSELTLIPRNPNHHYGLSVGLGACDGQVINEVPAKVQFIVDPLGSRIQAMVISPVLECVIGIDILGSWNHHHIGSLVLGKNKWKHLKPPPSTSSQNSKENTYFIPGVGDNLRLCPLLKFKDSRVVTLSFLFNSLE